MFATLLLCGLALVAGRPSHHQFGEDSRGLSAFTGWGPGNGMAMFASSSADEDPWAMQPPPVWKLGNDGTPRPLEREAPPRKKESRKKHHRQQEDEEDEDYSDEKGGSRANASFNAWFPILLGGYSDRDEGGVRSRQSPATSGREGVAAVANSVNHARSGVANSHAIVYSGEPGFPESLRRRNNFYR